MNTTNSWQGHDNCGKEAVGGRQERFDVDVDVDQEEKKR